MYGMGTHAGHRRIASLRQVQQLKQRQLKRRLGGARLQRFCSRQRISHRGERQTCLLESLCCSPLLLRCPPGHTSLRTNLHPDKKHMMRIGINILPQKLQKLSAYSAHTAPRQWDVLTWILQKEHHGEVILAVSLRHRILNHLLQHGFSIHHIGQRSLISI